VSVPSALHTDDRGFREYVTKRSNSLLRTAYLLTGNRADAEDLVQAALAKTYLAWDRIEDRGALDGYVRRAMVNTHISWWRRRRLDEYPTDDIPDRAVADHATGDSDLQDTLRRAIDRLPQRMRAAVMLRYYEDMTEAEVADALGVSLGTVKSTVSRAVAKLRIDAELLAELFSGSQRSDVSLLTWHYPPRNNSGIHPGTIPALRRIRLRVTGQAQQEVGSAQHDDGRAADRDAIMRYGTSAYGDREVVTCTGGRVTAPDLCRRRACGRRGSRTRCAAWAWTPTSASARSCGTTPSISRPTWRSRPWARCCTP
jgi:RNA polymerase sigma-70 factor (sigma-E family)